MNRLNGELIRDENHHIRQSVADILLTPIGTRLVRRDYGSRIPELLDRPINATLLLQLAAAAVMALNRWEPRIEVSRFQPRLTDNGMTISLTARRKQGNTEIAFDDLLLQHQ